MSNMKCQKRIGKRKGDDFLKKRKLIYKIVGFLTILSITFAACATEKTKGTDGAAGSAQTDTALEQNGTAAAVTLLDVSELFTDRDLEVGYDDSEATIITLSGNTATVASQADSGMGAQTDSGADAQTDSGAVVVGEKILTITGEGCYVLQGSFDGQLVIDADKNDKIQLVLDNASITCENSAALYVRKADKVFVTTTAGSENMLKTSGEYVAIDDNNIDGAIFSKSDLTLNGEGTLEVVSEVGNGIVSKDDLVITSGIYEINAGHHGLEGKDSVRIANGSFRITSDQDGIHSGNDEDATVGFTYIGGGTFDITAGDDGVHSDTQLVIAGGNIQIAESYEGLEGTQVEIAGGEISVKASDDGINAAGGTTGTEEYSILISGGKLIVDAEGDGVDSNGTLTVSGGEILIYGPKSGGDGALDYETEASISGGSLIALGNSGMATNFGSSSTQCSIMVTFENIYLSGAVVQLLDSSGKVLQEATATKEFNNVVFSCKDIQVGETYTVKVTEGTEEETQSIEMTDIVYGDGFGGPGGPGGSGGPGGHGFPGDGVPDGNAPDFPDGKGDPDGKDFSDTSGGDSQPDRKGGPDRRDFPDISGGDGFPGGPGGFDENGRSGEKTS